MPHRIATYKRYRISDDVLILILQKLTPRTLLRTCQAFQRVYLLVVKFQPLRYSLELGMFGMLDGPAPQITRPPTMRLPLLMAYKTEWPLLAWTNELKIKVPSTSSQIGVSGDFVYHTGDQSLTLLELPSCRTGRPPSLTRHFKFNTSPQSESVAIDAVQSLIIVGQTAAGPGGQIALRLKIRNLQTFEKHPQSPSPYFDCATHVAQTVSNLFIYIAGNRVLVTINFVGDLTKHLLLEWITCRATWLDDQDLMIVNSHHLLGVKKVHGRPLLQLYNIHDIQHVAIERQYELPSTWSKSTLRFGQNVGPRDESPIPANALFYADPHHRLTVISATKTAPAGTTQWLLIDETFFRPTVHPDRRQVPWSHWSQFCLIKEFAAGALVGVPQVVGNRIIYVEKNKSTGVDRFGLGIIDFAIREVENTMYKKTWCFVGPMAPNKPNENLREIPTSSTNGLPIKHVAATEDNIVLVMETQGDTKPVNVLTFGVPAPRPAQIANQHAHQHHHHHNPSH